ncbi:hypothetical protein CPB85DRAFT_184243 [Mucidula mucida]|nr:hypothetical protein CPB85DRAFT_417958 [Mucidula mucida]KAF8899987.1 hypothetical protein CPB85DRAFT_184118 [Mucidula mucida]KAF8899995.1 hypothetical protein CPB85DRAFT_184243 [Mucidula mucida]
MAKPYRVINSHPLVVQEAAKAVADLHNSAMLSRLEIQMLIRHFKHDRVIDFSPNMLRYATGTSHTKLGLVHRRRRIVGANELYTVFLSFRLDPSLETIRRKINAAFCDIPPEAIVAWHRKIVEDLLRPEASAGVGVAAVSASTLNGGDASDSVAVAPVGGNAGPSRQAADADATVSLTESSPGPSDDNAESVSEPMQLDVEVLGDCDVVSSIMNDAPEAEVAVLVSEGTPERADSEGAVISDCLPGSLNDIVDPPSLTGAGVGGVASITTDVSTEVIEAAAGLAEQAGHTGHLGIKVAEADGSCDPSTVSEPLIINIPTILPADSVPSQSSTITVTPILSEALSLPAYQVVDGSSDASSSSKDGVSGKRSLPIDDDADVPSQASPKRQKSNWLSRFWFY